MPSDLLPAGKRDERGNRPNAEALRRSAHPITCHVLFRRGLTGRSGENASDTRQESIGGRFEGDGTFRGTCWLVTGSEPAEGEEPQWEMTPRAPESAEVAALRALVRDLLDREALAGRIS
jgi:hypothetical protein